MPFWVPGCCICPFLVTTGQGVTRGRARESPEFHQAPNGQKQPYLSLLFTVATAIMMTPLLVFWLLDTKAKGPWRHPWFVMTKTCWVQGRSLQIIPEGSENDDREERRIRQELICISCIQAWAITIVLKSLQKKRVCRTLVEWWMGSL